MTRTRSQTAFLLVAAIVTLYATIFPLLTIDTFGRIVGRSASFEMNNLALLIFLEISRLFTSLTGITIAIVLIVRGFRRAEARSLSLFLLFAIVAFEKVFGTNSYPGPVQERVTGAVLDAGASPGVLAWLFGETTWPVWLAAAALLRFSVVFPRQLEPETLDASGRADRRGLWRAHGVAGADIGSFFRGASKRGLVNGLFTTRALIEGAAILIAVHTLLRGPIVTTLLWVTGLGVLCVAITNIRAAYAVAGEEDRVRITWLTEGLVLALGIFLISGAMLVTIPSVVARMAAFVLVMLAPVAIMACMALSVLDRGELNARDAVGRTVRAAGIMLALTIAFGLLYMVFEAVANRLGMTDGAAALAAAAVIALRFDLLEKGVDRLRLRILERT